MATSTGWGLLMPLSDLIGIPIDQVNFIVGNLVAIGLGQFMRKQASPQKASVEVRMILEILFGLVLTVFCFGHQCVYLLLQSIVAWLALRILPTSRTTSLLVTLWSMGFLGASHIYRQRYDYGGYTLDISGPLMIQTQRLSSLAFGMYDGSRLNKGQSISEVLKRHAVFECPSLLEFMAYTLYFHGVLAGPFVFYTEYKAYIRGYGLDQLPSARKQLSLTLSLALLHGLLTGYISPQFPYTAVVTTEFANKPMTRKLIFTTISFLLVRQKYYFAWAITEAAGLSAGLGFSGFSKDGEPEWEAIKNSNIRGIESGSSLKIIVDSWNIKTARWLRELVYERTPTFMRVPCVFLCSAFWHGFYPGYYMMFLSFALFTITARTVRRRCRPFFQQSPISSMSYDILTTIVANLTTNYCQGPFILLEAESGLLFWKAFYFIPHMVAVFILFLTHLKDNNHAITIRMKKLF